LPLQTKPQAPKLKYETGYYKSVEILTNFQYQASLHKRKTPPSKHFLAMVLGGLIITVHTNAYLFCPPSSRAGVSKCGAPRKGLRAHQDVMIEITDVTKARSERVTPKPAETSMDSTVKPIK